MKSDRFESEITTRMSKLVELFPNIDFHNEE